MWFGEKNDLRLKAVEDIHFKTKMAFAPADAGSFIDLVSSKEYFYFAINRLTIELKYLMKKEVL